MHPDSQQQRDPSRSVELSPPRSGLLAGTFRRLIDRWRPAEEMSLLLPALVVGVCAGLGAVIFRYLIRSMSWLGYELIPALTRGWGNAYVLVVPAVGGLIVGLLIHYFAREAKGHGVPEVIEAVALHDGRIRPAVAWVKAVASSVCIGSGGSVGREGPIVQIGSALGSTIAQKLRLSADRTANLVACGAAGGIAATFNAPIAGALFALEVILGGRFAVRYFSSVVVSAVAASVIGRIAFGNVPAFDLPVEYGIHSLWEFLLYPILGVVAALAATAFVRMLYRTEDLFDSMKSVPEWVKPAIGGAMLGGIALLYPLLTPLHWEGTPQIFNVGYAVITQTLANGFVVAALAGLFLLKLLATSLTLGSGGSGGVFAPSLFMGAMLGGTFEHAVGFLIPGITAPAGAYALVGMATLFAAAANAPVTSVLILFELTGDYRIILPLMLTVAVATTLTQRLLHGESVYTLKLTRRGVRLQHGRDVDLLEAVQVREVMLAAPETVQVDDTLAGLAELLRRTRRRASPVIAADGRLWGIATMSDLDRALEQGLPRSTPVAKIGTTWPNLLCAYADMTIGEALGRMGPSGHGSLPVVARNDRSHLLGLIARRDIIRAYELACTRRAVIQHHTERLRSIHEDADVGFVEIALPPDAAAVGRTVRDLAARSSRGWVLVSIRRAGRVVIPHGETTFEAGDRITAFVRRQDTAELARWLEHGNGADD